MILSLDLYFRLIKWILFDIYLRYGCFWNPATINLWCHIQIWIISQWHWQFLLNVFKIAHLSHTFLIILLNFVLLVYPVITYGSTQAFRPWVIFQWALVVRAFNLLWDCRYIQITLFFAIIPQSSLLMLTLDFLISKFILMTILIWAAPIMNGKCTDSLLK